MNIGHWITIGFISFTIFIGAIATICIRQDISLVEEDYYKEELAYSGQMEKMGNYQALKEKPVLRIAGQLVTLSFHESNLPEEGKIHFFRPDAAHLDQKFEIEKARAEYSFKKSTLKPGKWKVKLTYQAGIQTFYHEFMLII